MDNNISSAHYFEIHPQEVKEIICNENMEKCFIILNHELTKNKIILLTHLQQELSNKILVFNANSRFNPSSPFEALRGDRNIYKIKPKEIIAVMVPLSSLVKT